MSEHQLSLARTQAKTRGEIRGKLTPSGRGLGPGEPGEGIVGAGEELRLRELRGDAVVGGLRDAVDGAVVVLADALDDDGLLELEVVDDAAGAVQRDGLEDLAHALRRPVLADGVLAEPRARADGAVDLEPLVRADPARARRHVPAEVVQHRRDGVHLEVDGPPQRRVGVDHGRAEEPRPHLVRVQVVRELLDHGLGVADDLGVDHLDPRDLGHALRNSGSRHGGGQGEEGENLHTDQFFGL